MHTCHLAGYELEFCFYVIASLYVIHALFYLFTFLYVCVGGSLILLLVRSLLTP